MRLRFEIISYQHSMSYFNEKTLGVMQDKTI